MGAIIVCSASLLFGILLLFTVVPPIFKIRGTRNWQTVRGRVVNADVAVAAEWISTSARPHFWTPRVVYAYVVDGKEYFSQRLNFVGFSTGEAIATKMRYETQRHVTVWYDPDNPVESVLDRSGSATIWFFVVVAGCWCTVSLILLIDAVRAA